MAIRPIISEILQSKTKVVDHQANIAIPRATLLACITSKLMNEI